MSETNQPKQPRINARDLVKWEVDLEADDPVKLALLESAQYEARDRVLLIVLGNGQVFAATYCELPAVPQE